MAKVLEKPEAQGSSQHNKDCITKTSHWTEKTWRHFLQDQWGLRRVSMPTAVTAFSIWHFSWSKKQEKERGTKEKRKLFLLADGVIPHIEDSSKGLLCVCMYTHMYIHSDAWVRVIVCSGTHAHVCTCEGLATTSGVIFTLLHSLWDKISHLVWGSPMRLNRELRALPPSTAPSRHYEPVPPWHIRLYGFQVSNSGPHIFKACILLTDLSLSSQKDF